MMMRWMLILRVAVPLALSGLMCGNVLANESTCKRVLEIDPQFDSKQCVCDERLKNIKVTLPREMKLVAACEVRWSDGTVVDLGRTVVSLDMLTNGDVPAGEYVLAGERAFSGVVTLEDQPDAADVVFTPSFGTSAAKPYLLGMLAEGFTFPEKDRVRLGVDARLKSHPCSQADIEFKAAGIEVVLGEQPSATALNTEILKLSPYRNCRKAG